MTRVMVDRGLLEQLIGPEVTTGQNPEDWYDCRHCGSHWTSDTPEVHTGSCPVPAVQAALTKLPAEPERALVTELEILRRGWEREAIVIYAQETVKDADGSTTWLDNECRTEHDTLRRCIAELAALNQPTPEPEPCDTCTHVTDNLGQINYCYRCGRRFPEHQAQPLSLEEVIALESPKWAGVTDPTAWVRELRGDTPDGEQVRHRKSGRLYALVGPGRHKVLGGRWVETVVYRNAEGELFSREVDNFEQAFEYLAQLHKVPQAEES